MSVKDSVVQALNLKSGNLDLNLSVITDCVTLRTPDLWVLATFKVEKWRRIKLILLPIQICTKLFAFLLIWL